MIDNATPEQVQNYIKKKKKTDSEQHCAPLKLSRPTADVEITHRNNDKKKKNFSHLTT